MIAQTKDFAAANNLADFDVVPIVRKLNRFLCLNFDLKKSNLCVLSKYFTMSKFVSKHNIICFKFTVVVYNNGIC